MPFWKLTQKILDRFSVFCLGIFLGGMIGLSFLNRGNPLDLALASDGAPKTATTSLHSQQHMPATATVTAATSAAARTDCSENFPLSPNVISALRTNRAIRIGIFGDSFGDGIWAGTLQELHGKPGFQVFHFSKESTGLTSRAKPDALDYIRSKTEDQAIDIAVVDFGANDMQGVWVHGSAAPFMSNKWRVEMSSRATKLVEFLRAKGSTVAWIGLPRMRNEHYDGEVQLMNAFYRDLMCKLRVPYVDPVAVTEDRNHAFSSELLDPNTGEPYLARADDGIHMTVHGYRVIAAPILHRIEALMPPPQSEASGKGAPP